MKKLMLLLALATSSVSVQAMAAGEEAAAPAQASYCAQAREFAQEKILGTTYGRGSMLGAGLAAAYGASALYQKYVAKDATPCKTAVLAPVNTVKAWIANKKYGKLVSAVLGASLAAAFAADFVVNGTDMSYTKAAYNATSGLVANVLAKFQTAEAAAPAADDLA